VRARAPACPQVSGTFWLSRLMRDRDVTLRALAGDLLARLLEPGAGAAHAMVHEVRARFGFALRLPPFDPD
jgi:hypothetical protein